MEYNCLLIKVDWLDACIALWVVGAVLVVFLRRKDKICTIIQPMESKGRYLNKSIKPCWPIKSKVTWIKYKQLTFLNQRELTLFSREIHAMPRWLEVSRYILRIFARLLFRRLKHFVSRIFCVTVKSFTYVQHELFSGLKLTFVGE